MMKKLRRKLNIGFILTLSLVWLLIPLAVVQAATFYVDPINGDMSNDGSYERPWRTLQEVFEMGLIETQVYETTPYTPGAPLKLRNPGAPVKAGDTILLRSGYHGEIFLRGGFNSDYITIASQDGHTPYLKRIWLSAVSKWILRGLTVSPELAPEYATATLIFIESHGWHGASYDVIIENNNLYSVQDTSGWTADDWNNLSCSGIHVHSPDSIVRNNTLKNVNFGIVITGNNTLVEHNIIENIAGDGIVVGADDVTLQYNTIKNFYDVNANHDDGIQFHRGTNPDRIPMKNAILRGNIIISHDPDITNPLISSPQGIGCFDNGMYIGWLVENNLVLVQHYHGISIYGAQDSTIVNNLAFDPTGQYPAWISLGSDPQNTVVRNNMSEIIPNPDPSRNVVVDHNIDINDYDLDMLFVDYQNHDMRHKEGSPAIDAGSGELAPDTDIKGNPRPYGIGYDIGAYEYTLLPRVVISAQPEKGYLPLKVLFSISELLTPNGEIETWKWDFGDGATSQEKEPSHIYTSPGEYTVTLTVIDIQGYKGQARTHITVLKEDKEFGKLSMGCYNNVFNPLKGEEALIIVELPNQARVKVNLYNTRGNRIRKLVDKEENPGTRRYYWNGRDDSGNVVGSGLYFVHVETGDYKKTKKIVVVK